MNSFQILAILACVAGLNAFRVGNPVIGKCPAVITTKPDFDYKQVNNRLVLNRSLH